MIKVILLSVIIMCFECNASRLPGPQVYVVTPSSRRFQIDEAKPPPFYYHNWKRRMDTDPATTTTIAPTVTTVKTPDLIFAEFESNDKMQKSIRKLLEKEKIKQKTTTSQPININSDEMMKVTHIVNYGLPLQTDNMKDENSHRFERINSVPGPVYLPSTTTTASTVSTTPVNIENIWHIIDNEKLNQQTGNWDEISFGNNESVRLQDEPYRSDLKNKTDVQNNETEDVKIDDNFALPGFATNPGSGADNESRALRNEQNLRFPYVNLKPFQIKGMKKPLLTGNSKKTNMIDLNNFYDLKEPVRGEAQDISPVHQQVDRYNPAQPYLPKPGYGSNIPKQNGPVAPPKFVANLVPPPPSVPKISGDDFPSPATYESFPPYPPSLDNDPSVTVPKPPAPAMDSSVMSSLGISDGVDSSDDSGSEDSSVMDLGYRYKPPSAPQPQFIPTVPPPSKLDGYSYNKPSATDGMGLAYGEKPSMHGYEYKKPEPMPTDDTPDFHGYQYSKPDVPQFFDHKPSNGGHFPTPDHDSHYPELIFDKPHDDMKDDDMKNDDDMNGGDMGMKPPPPPGMTPNGYGPVNDDHGYPSDFPGDFKYHHDFDDHDHDHDHDHHHTTTTEMPRVNRYSYYYLGKKLYYLPLYFSIYFIVYVGALIIKAVLRHKIVYPNSWRPNSTTATYFSKRSVDAYLSNDNLHEITGRVTHAIATAAERYVRNTSKTK